MGCGASKEPQFITAPAANGVADGEPAFYYTDEPTAYAHESSLARVRPPGIPSRAACFCLLHSLSSGGRRKRHPCCVLHHLL